MKRYKIKKMIPILLISCIIILIVVFGIALLINFQIINQSKSYWIHNIQGSSNKQVGLVLGARVFEDGYLSQILKDRMDVGIDLYKKDKVDKLILSGDHGNVEYDEVNAMKNYALKKGVPIEDIFLDHAGFRTYDSLYRAKEVFNVDSLVVVTQAFHLDRAIYLGRSFGLDVFGIPSDKRIYQMHWTNRMREFLARTMAYLEVHLFPHPPKYLGPKIDIQGDGRQTHDYQ